MYVSVTVRFLLQEPSDDLDDLNFFNQKKKKKKTKKVFENEIEEGIKVSHGQLISSCALLYSFVYCVWFCHFIYACLVPPFFFFNICPTKLGHEN